MQLDMYYRILKYAQLWVKDPCVSKRDKERKARDSPARWAASQHELARPTGGYTHKFSQLDGSRKLPKQFCNTVSPTPIYFIYFFFPLNTVRVTFSMKDTAHCSCLRPNSPKLHSKLNTQTMHSPPSHCTLPVYLHISNAKSPRGPRHYFSTSGELHRSWELQNSSQGEALFGQKANLFLPTRNVATAARR